VNEYLGPIFEEALKPLVERGLLRIVYGGAAEGAYLCNHSQVDEISHHRLGQDSRCDRVRHRPGRAAQQGRADAA